MTSREGSASTAPNDPRLTEADPARGPVNEHDQLQVALTSDTRTKGGRVAVVLGATVVALVLGAIILVLLLVFVLQNNTSASFEYFAAEFSLPLGVAILLAAVAGALVMALVGSAFALHQTLTIRKLRKQIKQVQQLLGGNPA